MSKIERDYLGLITKCLNEGVSQDDRTGVGTLSIVGETLRHNLQEGFPLLTTKKVYWKGVVEELLWFLRGETNVKPLQEKNVHIWDAWAKEDGSLGPVYGHQWVSWEGWIERPDDMYLRLHNQVQDLIDEARRNPNSRRLLVSAWNVADLDRMALPPCHYSWEVHILGGRLSLIWNQRSVDTLLGLPFNLASYALLAHMLAHVLELEVGDLIFRGGNIHVYKNHIEGALTQLQREPRALPTLKINRRVENIFDFKFEDFSLEGYDPHPPIKMEVAVGIVDRNVGS